MSYAIRTDGSAYRAVLSSADVGEGEVYAETLESFAPAGPDQAQVERVWRDGEIERITWLRERHRDQLELGLSSTLAAEQFAELLAFIQQLRDWPQSEAFPAVELRPGAPAWLEGALEA